MARTKITPTKFTPNGFTAAPAGTTGIADGHYVDVNERTGVRDQVQPELLLIQVTVATAANDVTIRGGDYPPAMAAGQGDLTQECPIGVSYIGPFESGRFLKNSGQVWIDSETPANNTFRVFAFPSAV